MRIALVYNPNAGHGDIERDDLRRRLEAGGHRVEVFGKKKRDMNDAIASAPDVLAVAGGDGTVAKAAIVSFRKDSRAPLFILPAGTANNIARSLGITRPAPELIGALATMRPMPLDVGCVRDGGKERFFVESAGVGFIGAMLRHPMSPRARLLSAIRGFITGRDVAERTARGVERISRAQPPIRVSLIVDGQDLSDHYISVEALNTREVGPHLPLAPGADCGDGMLDLALCRDSSGATRIRRSRAITMSWCAQYGHIDDEPWPKDAAAGDRKVTIAIAGRVPVLLSV